MIPDKLNHNLCIKRDSILEHTCDLVYSNNIGFGNKNLKEICPHLLYDIDE